MAAEPPLPPSDATQFGEDPTASEPGPSRAARRSRRTRDSRRAKIEWAILIAFAVIVAIVIRAFVFQAFFIPSESMVPTLEVGDRVLVNKLSYRLHDPNRGDIVVFKAPERVETAEIKDLVKRIVGLPGETIQGKDGRILIDGKVIEESYLPDAVTSTTFGPVEVPKDSYFLLGDNRANSKDSTDFGPIRRDQLIGRVFLRFWPLDRLGFL